jgi:hypothetical protein
MRLPRFRLRTMMVAVALVAVAMGGYRTWGAWAENRRLADEHSERAKWWSEIAEHLEKGESYYEGLRECVETETTFALPIALYFALKPERTNDTLAATPDKAQKYRRKAAAESRLAEEYRRRWW